MPILISFDPDHWRRGSPNYPSRSLLSIVAIQAQEYIRARRLCCGSMSTPSGGPRHGKSFTSCSIIGRSSLIELSAVPSRSSLWPRHHLRNGFLRSPKLEAPSWASFQGPLGLIWVRVGRWPPAHRCAGVYGDCGRARCCETAAGRYRHHDR